MTEEQLSALLRLKRFEQPPPGYYDDLLRNVHRRQREELLQRPLWKIAAERIQTFFGEHSMSPATYAGAMATLMIFGLTVISVVGTGKGAADGIVAGAVASAVPAQRTENPSVLASPRTLNIQTGVPTERYVSFDNDRRYPAPSAQQQARQPRYVIDARPVSYEAPFRF